MSANPLRINYCICKIVYASILAHEKNELLKQLKDTQIQCEDFRDKIVTLTSQLEQSQRELSENESLVEEYRKQIRTLMDKTCTECSVLNQKY